ncbi:hypothetical protein IFM89_033271 [Coptis chinensis]|uniref:Uncharacterized protein n=1 Tax=Coptis chinensis TaxID=261450 RepID=A0A835IDU9_9MAGN|nr:hypothetical protein IFM89_033271 [Coptis chinensis]
MPFLAHNIEVMSKFVEFLNMGMKIVGRFQSQYPQTARKYYHPPTNVDDHQNYFLFNSHDRTSGDNSEVSNFKAMDELDTTEFFLYSAL